MKILRQVLFSKKSKEEENKKRKNIDGKVGAALVGAGLVSNTAAGFKTIDVDDIAGYKTKIPKFLKPSKLSENDRLQESLEKQAKKSGLDIEKVDGLIGLGSPAGYDMNSKKVLVSDLGGVSADTFAHELGHAHYDNSKDAGKVGKLAHKAYKKLHGGLSFTLYSPAAAIGSGITSGIVKAKKEKNGKKESKLNKALPYLAPTAIATPGLISEVAASHAGLKLLKKAGASKKDLGAARKNLANAALTYGTLAAINAGIGGISKHIAYKATKKADERKNKDNK